MNQKFQRKIEDFECENCGYNVEGDGYTNHCPMCLWSKHVDVNPGDREEPCLGMMEPIDIESKKGEYRILLRCTRCQVERWNKASKQDDFEILLQIMAEKKGSR
jgi:hypothetical protein